MQIASTPMPDMYKNKKVTPFNNDFSFLVLIFYLFLRNSKNKMDASFLVLLKSENKT